MWPSNESEMCSAAEACLYACVPRGDVGVAPWRFQEDAFSWVLFHSKINLWWFRFSLSYELGESARRPLSPDFLCGHYHSPFRPQLRPLGCKWTSGDCAYGHQWGGKRKVCRQATLTKIFLPKALILAMWIHHWKTAMFSILRFHVPYVSLCCFLFCCIVCRVKMEMMHAGTGLSDFISFAFTNFVIMGKWLNLYVFVFYP